MHGVVLLLRARGKSNADIDFDYGHIHRVIGWTGQASCGVFAIDLDYLCAVGCLTEQVCMW